LPATSPFSAPAEKNSAPAEKIQRQLKNSAPAEKITTF
jgi:hypothetical protein